MLCVLEPWRCTGGTHDDWSYCVQGEPVANLCGAPTLTRASLHGDAHACLPLGELGGTDWAANDPLYFFLHANVERQRLTWMYYNRHQREHLWRYPALSPWGDGLFELMGAQVLATHPPEPARPSPAAPLHRPPLLPPRHRRQHRYRP